MELSVGDAIAAGEVVHSRLGDGVLVEAGAEIRRPQPQAQYHLPRRWGTTYPDRSACSVAQSALVLIRRREQLWKSEGQALRFGCQIGTPRVHYCEPVRFVGVVIELLAFVVADTVVVVETVPLLVAVPQRAL